MASIYPTSLTRQINVIFRVLLKMTATEAEAHPKVGWTLATPPAEAKAGTLTAVISPTVSETSTYTYAVPTGSETGEYIATTQIKLTSEGSATLIACDLGEDGKPDPAKKIASASLRCMNASLDRNSFEFTSVAANPAFGDPVNPTAPGQFLELSLKIVDEHDELDDPQDFPVFIKFTPDVSEIFQLEGNAWVKPELEYDPDLDSQLGYIFKADANGYVKFRMGSNEKVVGSLMMTVADDTQEERFVIATMLKADGTLAVPTNLDPHVDLDRKNTPFFNPKVPSDINLEMDRLGVMWFQGKDPAHAEFGNIARMSQLVAAGDEFPYADVDASGTANNAVAYLYQRGNNAIQSRFYRFSADGAAYVDPDTTVDRTLPTPKLSEPQINTRKSWLGITLTVPVISPSLVLKNAASFVLQPILYLHGWEPGGAKKKATALRLKAITYSATATAPAQLPTTEVDYLLSAADLAGYDHSSQGQQGYCKIEYVLHAFPDDNNIGKPITYYSKILGIAPPIILDTDPLSSDPSSHTDLDPAVYRGLYQPSARRTVPAIQEPVDD